jgi:purine-binding chemotaxis protein CheW
LIDVGAGRAEAGMATQETRNTEAGTQGGATQVVLFQLAGKSFAVELGQVEQIIDYRAPAKTPRRPVCVEGVAEYRGRYLAIVDLRKRFGVTEEKPAHPAVLVLRGVGPDPVVGLVVDQVLRVLPLPPDGVLRPPPRVFGIRAEYIRGVANAAGRPLVWLDLAKVLTSQDAITLLA